GAFHILHPQDGPRDLTSVGPQASQRADDESALWVIDNELLIVVRIARVAIVVDVTLLGRSRPDLAVVGVVDPTHAGAGISGARDNVDGGDRYAHESVQGVRRRRLKVRAERSLRRGRNRR